MNIKKNFPGDSGQTALFKKKGITKRSPIFSLLGDLDELNSVLGLAKINVKDKKVGEWLEKIQEDIFHISGYLSGADRPDIKKITEDLDLKYEYCLKNIPAIKNFVFPGGSLKSVYLDISRSICRRAERSAWLVEGSEPAKETAIWLNHLSKFFFFLGRLVDKNNDKKLRFFKSS